VTFNVWAIDLASVRNKFLVVTEMGKLSGISSKKEWKTWYGELSWVTLVILRHNRVPGSKP
jgi:hypothetical protein